MRVSWLCIDDRYGAGGGVKEKKDCDSSIFLIIASDGTGSKFYVLGCWSIVL